MPKRGHDGKGPAEEAAAKRAALEGLEWGELREIRHLPPKGRQDWGATLPPPPGGRRDLPPPSCFSTAFPLIWGRRPALPRSPAGRPAVAASHDQAADDEVDDMGIPRGWRECPAMGRPIERFIPMKVPLGARFDSHIAPEHRFTIDDAVAQARRWWGR